MDYTKLIETQRLVLRKATISDAENIFKNYASRDKVTEFLSWQSHRTVDDTISYLENVVLPAYSRENYHWFIELKENHEIIGCIDVVKIINISNKNQKSGELGWVLSNDYWGQGIMPEAARAVFKYLLSLKFLRLEAKHNVLNSKSGRVMAKIGMKFEGLSRKGGLNNKGEFVDMKIYSFIAGEDDLM